MGHVTHRAVLVFASADVAETAVEEFRASLPENLRPRLVGPIAGIVNTHYQYVFLSSGSKDGWGTHDLVDEWQDRFVKLFDQYRFGDGSTPFSIITVQLGEGDYGPLLYDSPKRYLHEDGVPYVTQYDKENSDA